MNPLEVEFARIRRSRPQCDLQQRNRERRKELRTRYARWQSPWRDATPFKGKTDYGRRLDSVHELSVWSVLLIAVAGSSAVLTFVWYEFFHALRII
jgi:hypothetical protein